MSEMRPVTDKEVRDAAERLRQTTAADDATDAAGVEAGYELGVRWACEIADYDELKTYVEDEASKTPSRALSGRGARLSSVTEPARRGTLAEGTGAGPTAQQGLQLAQELPQRQADAAGFGRRSRSRVRKPWATETNVTWWCQPPKLRPS
jgi:hypothetical protein